MVVYADAHVLCFSLAPITQIEEFIFGHVDAEAHVLCSSSSHRPPRLELECKGGQLAKLAVFPGT